MHISQDTFKNKFAFVAAFRHTRDPNFVFLSLSLLAFVALNGAACGKRRPPVPPGGNQSGVARQNDVSLAQRGDVILINIPERLLSNSLKTRKADFFRLAEARNAPLFLSEEDFFSRSTLVGSIDLTKKNNNEVVFLRDKINPNIQNRRLRYAIRFVNENGQRTAVSNFAFIEPSSNVAKPPSLSEIETTQNELKLRWTPPTENIDDSRPVNLVGYNVYRKSAAGEQKINPSLLSTAAYADPNFSFNEQYQYFARSVSSGVNGVLIESENSNVVSIAPKDVFPPEAPTGLTIAAAPRRLSLFFAANNETDIAGYFVFRSENMDLPLAEWMRLNEQPLGATSYQDARVISNRKYYYYVTAVDVYGNTSEPSEIVAEIDP